MQALESILQLHVATDQAAITHLPFVISILTQEFLQPSPHLSKWTARVNSLLVSKNAGSRWAGLCLALQTSVLNEEILKDCSQNWISICLPTLSRNEDIPNVKASIRLLNYIFFRAPSIPEFQRRLAIPNIPKYSAALLGLIERIENLELQGLCLESLTRLIPVYPALHRQLQTDISSLCFRLLSGKTTGSDPNIVDLSCGLLSVLHLTGGKVASTIAWQKTLETSIVNAWSAFASVRLTFLPFEVPTLTQSNQPTFKSPPSDPLIAVPLGIDRLKSALRLIIQLLKTPVYRPTAVNIGELVGLVSALINCTLREDEPSFDVQRRALESAVVPQIWKIACDLLSQMAISFKHHLNPSLCRILSRIIHNAEQVLDKSHKLIFLRSLKNIIAHTYNLHSEALLNRLVKYLLSRLAVILPQKIIATSSTQELPNKKGTKRVREFEGSEVFQVGVAVVCANHVDEELLLFSLDVLDLLLPNPHLNVSLRTLSARLLLSVLFELSRCSAVQLSRNPHFHGTLYNKTLFLCKRQLTSVTPGWLHNGVGLIIGAIDRANVSQGDENVFLFLNESRHEIDILLHPRLPPPLRSNPPAEVNCEMPVLGGTQEIETLHTSSATQPQVEREPLSLPAAMQVPEVRNKVDGDLSNLLNSSGTSNVNPHKPAENLLTGTPMDTKADVVSFPLKDHTIRVEKALAILGSTSERSNAPTSPRIRENTPHQPVQQWQMAKMSDSDIDDEEIPQVNVESDSD